MYNYALPMDLYLTPLLKHELPVGNFMKEISQLRTLELNGIIVQLEQSAIFTLKFVIIQLHLYALMETKV